MTTEEIYKGWRESVSGKKVQSMESLVEYVYNEALECVKGMLYNDFEEDYMPMVRDLCERIDKLKK